MTTPTLPSKDTSYAALNESLIGEIDLEEDSYIRSLPQNILPIRERFFIAVERVIKITTRRRH